MDVKAFFKDSSAENKYPSSKAFEITPINSKEWQKSVDCKPDPNQVTKTSLHKGQLHTNKLNHRNS